MAKFKVSNVARVKQGNKRASAQSDRPEYVIPTAEDVNEVVETIDSEELAETFLLLVATSIVSVSDGYTPWVPTWIQRRDGISREHLYMLAASGHCKSGGGAFAPTFMLPQRGSGSSSARKDARVSDIMRQLRSASKVEGAA